MKNSCLVDYSVDSDMNLTPITIFDVNEERKRTGGFQKNLSRRSIHLSKQSSLNSSSDNIIQENDDFAELKDNRENLLKLQKKLNENTLLSSREKSSISNHCDYILQILSSKITEENLERVLPEFGRDGGTRTERKNASILDMNPQTLPVNFKKKRYML